MVEPRKIDIGGGLEMVVAGHLGGYIIGGDPATYYPDLWRWLVEEHSVKSVIDVGCGDGQAVDFFRQHGCIVTGIDGVPQEDDRIVVHDYTTGPCPPVPTPAKKIDLVWSCEFVEHVEERYAPNFLATFACSERFVLMTHGEPGQPGHHHVNNQSSDYWTGALAAIGFGFDAHLTGIARALAGLNPDFNNHFERSGLVFRRY